MVGQYGNVVSAKAPTDDALQGATDRDEQTRYALRVVLTLPKSASNAAIFTLADEVPLAALDHAAAMRYWTNLPKKNVAVRIAFAALKDNMDKATPGSGPSWASVIRSSLEYYGGNAGREMWEEQRRGWSISRISDIVRTKCAEINRAAIIESGSLQLLRHLDIDQGRLRALEIFRKSHRNSLVRLLSGTHHLESQTGKWSKTASYDRTCSCQSGEIGDEHHFLFDCDSFVGHRTKLREKLSDLGDREWDIDTLAWALTEGLFVKEGEGKQRRRVLQAIADFIYKSSRDKKLETVDNVV